VLAAAVAPRDEGAGLARLEDEHVHGLEASAARVPE